MARREREPKHEDYEDIDEGRSPLGHGGAVRRLNWSPVASPRRAASLILVAWVLLHGHAATSSQQPAASALPEHRAAATHERDSAVVKGALVTQFMTFEVRRNGDAKRRYVVLHGNEVSARKALLEHLRGHRGIAYLITTSSRYIDVFSGRADPNRIFSDDGVERNLRLLNPGWGDEELQSASRALGQAREIVLGALLPPAGGLLVSVHNNRSVDLLQQELAISSDSSLRDRAARADFFLSTDATDFKILRASPFNVVLQDHPGGPDDGSLSRLAARRNVRYLNIECANGNVARQEQMLDWMDRNLP